MESTLWFSHLSTYKNYLGVFKNLLPRSVEKESLCKGGAKTPKPVNFLQDPLDGPTMSAGSLEPLK